MQRSTWHPALTWSALAVLVLGLFVGRAGLAATFTIDAVADAGDATPGDGYCDSILAGFDCTLRAAIQEANALAGPDTIVIPNLFLVLNIVGSEDAAIAGDLDVTDDLEINGSLFTTILVTHGEPAVQVHSGTFRLTDLTLMDGGIVSEAGAQLEVVDVDLDAAIVNRGRGHLVRAFIQGAPGTGVTNEGTLTISDAVISGNGSDFVDAGGIDNSGALIVERTAIQSNTGKSLSPGTAGGFYNRSSGVALVSNSVLQFNISSTGGTPTDVANDGWMRFSHVGVSGVSFSNTPAIHNTGVLSMQNSFLESIQLVCSGSAISSLGYNTITDGSCLAGLGPGDAENSNSFLDRVPAELCAVVDLAGNSRFSDGPCDSGAFEFGTSSSACGNGLDDDGDGLIDLQDPGCRDALDPLEAHIRPGDAVLANFDTGGVTVFDPETTRLFPITRSSGGVAPWDIDVDTDGEIHFSDSQFASLTSVDAEHGGAFLVSAGDQLQTPTGIAQNWLGEWFVGDRTSDAIFEIDPDTGVQALLSNDPDFGNIDDILRRPGTGSLYVSDTGSGIRLVTDPLGSPSVYTIATTTVTTPRQIAFDSGFDLVIADSGDNIPAWKDLQSISETSMLTAPGFTNMQGAAVEPSGLSLFTDYDTGEIKRVDEVADTATLLNSGREEPGLNHMALVPSAAELTLTLDDALVVDGGDPGVADVGDTLELTAVVTNVGPTTATLLSLESGLDPNLTLVAGQLTTTQGTLVEGSLASDPRLEVDLGNLGPAASATVTWRVDVSDPAPDRQVSANAWVRRDKVILTESDDPDTGPANDPNVIGVGDYGIVVQAIQKISDTRGELSGPGNPGSVLSSEGWFGGSLEPLGDIDGDGVADVAVGADFDSEAGGAGYGAFYILLLNSDGTVKQRFKWSAASPDLAAALSTAGLSLSDDRLGSAIAYLGDLDGGGPSDFALAVSAWYDDGGGTDRGAVYVFFMDASPLQVLSVSKIGDGVGGFPSGQLSDNDYLGMDVENAGDIDGDGVVDLAVGAHLDDTIGADSGGVWILFLTQSGTVKASPPAQILVSPSSAGDWLGEGIASLGLFDGDAVPDLAVGASRRDTGGADRGAVWILTLNANGTIKTQAEISDGVGGFPADLLENDDRFGRDLEVLPDRDGDGTVELVVGANRDNDVGIRTGAVYVLFLTPSGTTDKVVQLAPQPGVLLNELDDNDRLGLAIAPLGDLDSDGNLEIAVGAMLDDDGATNTGAVYVLNTLTPLPEPGALLGLASGIAFLATVGRRRMRP